MSELLIDSAIDESEANSPIKMTPQDDKGEVVYLSRARKGTMLSKLVIDKINEMKMKLGSRLMPRSGKDEGGFGDIDESCQFSETKTSRSHGFETR